MNLLNRKSKMISFRLSPGELLTLQDACAAHGVRSISELARTSMQRLIAAEPERNHLVEEVRDLRAQVRFMSAELDRIAAIVDARENHARRDTQ